MGSWRPRINSAVKAVLEELGVEYSLKLGTKHIKLFIGGRMVAVLPRDGGTSTSIETNQNVVSAIRRYVRANKT